jgi:hypothetical protein
MFTKLSKLESKLTNLDLEDLFTLTNYSSDRKYILYLQKFIIHYSECFVISEIFKENVTKKQYFIMTLIYKLNETLLFMMYNEKALCDNLNLLLSKEVSIKRKGKISSIRNCFSHCESYVCFVDSDLQYR